LFSSLRCFKRRGQPYKPKTKQNETSKQKGLKPAFSAFMLNIQLLKKKIANKKQNSSATP
jgi:hypothetical protein